MTPWKQLLIVAGAALALALTLPFAVLTVWAVLAVFLGWLYLNQRRVPWPQLWLALAVGLGSAPVISYDYWVSTTNPVLAGWSAQNITAAPSVINLLLGYGLVGVMAGSGGWLIVRQRHGTPDGTAGQWLVFWWAVTGLILLYLPFDLQRRLITGLHIPLCVLAAIGLSRGVAGSRLRLSRRRQLTAIVLILGILGTLFVWSLPLLATFQSPADSETTALLFMRHEEVAALTWLRENGAAANLVLASPRLSLFIPGQTGARVFYGHPFETVEANQKKMLVEAFYRGEIDQLTPAVDFIIYGPAERALGQPQHLAEWPVVFSADQVVIYKTE